jgi:hypothetical protein
MIAEEQERVPSLKNWPMKCSGKELTFHVSAGVGWNHAWTFQRIHLITLHVKPRTFYFLVSCNSPV